MIDPKDIPDSAVELGRAAWSVAYRARVKANQRPGDIVGVLDGAMEDAIKACAAAILNDMLGEPMAWQFESHQPWLGRPALAYTRDLEVAAEANAIPLYAIKQGASRE